MTKEKQTMATPLLPADYVCHLLLDPLSGSEWVPCFKNLRRACASINFSETTAFGSCSPTSIPLLTGSGCPKCGVLAAVELMFFAGSLLSASLEFLQGSQRSATKQQNHNLGNVEYVLSYVGMIKLQASPDYLDCLRCDENIHIGNTLSSNMDQESASQIMLMGYLDVKQRIR